MAKLQLINTQHELRMYAKLLHGRQPSPKVAARIAQLKDFQARQQEIVDRYGRGVGGDGPEPDKESGP